MNKWLEGVRFELSLQAHRRTVWVLGGLLLFPLVGVTLDRFDRAGGRDVLFGAPLAIAQGSVLMGLVALLIVAVVAGDAATRDVRTRLEPLMHAAPLPKATYLGSRFWGAFLISLVLFAAGPLAHALVPLTDPELARVVVGPFRPAAYLTAYVVFLVPNAFLATTAAFGGATLVRHTLGGWAGVLLIAVWSQVSRLYLGTVLGRWDLAQLLDPTGATTLELLARTWSPAQASTQPVAVGGPLLWNRVFWLGAAGLILLFTYRRFDFGGETSAGRWRGKRRTTPPTGARAEAPHGEAPASTHARPTDPGRMDRIPPSFGFNSRLHQTRSIIRDSFHELAPPWLWPVVPGLVAFQFFLTLSTLDTMGAGTPVAATTPLILRTLLPGAANVAPPIALAVVLLPILLAGELVWRERDANLAGLADVAPVSTTTWFFGKVLALWITMLAFFALVAAGGALAQARLDARALDPLLYVQLLGLRVVRPLLFCLFAFSIHVIVGRKPLGHVIALLLVLPLIGELLGLEHPLLLLGWEPAYHYSPLSGFEPFIGPVLWFDAYWAGWCLMLAWASRLFWVRGPDLGIAHRAQVALLRLRSDRSATAWVGSGLVVLCGAVIFYNTNVLNVYRTTADREQLRAEYERRFSPFQATPQPRLVATHLEVELDPERRQARVTGIHHLENRAGRPLDTVHVATSQIAETSRLELDRPARLDLADDLLGHRVFVLDEPLEPGDTLRLTWDVQHAQRGFPARGSSSPVVGNGSFLPMAAWMPLIGYQFSRELTDPAARRAWGLPERDAFPPPEAAWSSLDGYGRETIDLSVTVGTSADQIAVAPGELVRTWTEGSRSYFRYETGEPVGIGYALFSARYAVSTGRWRNVAIEVLHHPEHTANVRTMIRSMEASLERLSERFGVYPHRTLRMVEYPSPGGSLHAASGTIWYQELFSHFEPRRDPLGIDLPFAVVAHEVAHQFQPLPARREGQALLSESFAWYAALGVIEAELGPDHLGRLLDYMRRSYLTPRSRADVPLLRASDAFLGYRKGPFAMYALREYIGQDRVDTAWRRLRERHASPEPPFATSLDLYRELQQVTPDSLRSLLADLLEQNTFWDLGARSVTASPSATEGWDVSLEVDARKSVVDTGGMETSVEMDDLIEIGIYASDDLGEPLYLDVHRIRSGIQTISITVPGRPAMAGIDPRNLLIDVEPGNNRLDISASPPEGS